MMVRPSDTLRLFTILVTTFAIFTGCAKSTETSPSADLTIERVVASKSKSFIVTWRLAEPARVLVFKRGQFRENYWKPGPSQRLVSRGGYEILEADSATQEFSIVAPDAFIDFTDDFPFMVPFSDGGIVLVTTHFDAAPINCVSSCGPAAIQAAGASLRLKLRLRPAAGENVIIGNEASSSEVITDSGTMAYFGRQTVQTANGFRYVSDPETPAWVLSSTTSLLPRVLDLYADRLGQPLTQQPILFIPFIEGTTSFSSSHSGTVIGPQVLLALFGERWKTQSTPTREDLYRFVAHEAFHLWNASLSQDTSVTPSRWLHEGSADAFAYLALSNLSLLPQESLKGLQTEALNRCLLGLADSPLSQAGRAQYDCGATLQLLLHRNLRAHNGDLWKFWKQLLLLTPGSYNKDSFLKMVDELEPRISAALREVIEGRVVGDPSSAAPVENYFMRAYQQLGITPDLNERSLPKWYGLAASSIALSRSVEKDCGPGGQISIDEQGGIRLSGDANCQTIRSNLVVQSMESHPLTTQGAQAYDSVRLKCASSSSFLFRAESGEDQSLTCPQLPVRPRFFAFDLLPNL